MDANMYDISDEEDNVTTRRELVTNRFGFKTIDSDEETVPYFDEVTGVQLAPRFEFASQDWRQEEFNASFKTPFLCLNVVEDVWRNFGGTWMLSYRGRTGADCLKLFLSDKFCFPRELKMLVCSFLGPEKGVKHILPVKLLDRFELFNHSIITEGWERKLNLMIYDQNEYGTMIDGWSYSEIYTGERSYCSRCGQNRRERARLMMEGVCYSCGSAGLRYFPQLEYNVFSDDQFTITGRVADYRMYAILVLDSKVQLLCTDGYYKWHKGTDVDDKFDIEWPPMEHPEWFTKE